MTVVAQHHSGLGSINPIAGILSAAKRIGRPPVADPASERSRKPWIAAGVSERTYYRRKRAVADAAPPIPQQHAAHVATWYATLGALARLEHRALVRRYLIAALRS